jgi:anti-sigma regulatory factor (Ser/Thr protein kinase)
MRAPAEAREFIRRHLPGLGFPRLVDNATLVAVELVTNSVRYAPEGPIWLSLRLASGRPLVEVQDCSTRLPVFRDPDYAAESGRGLHVVDALCAILDWAPVHGGKVTWALLETK